MTRDLGITFAGGWPVPVERWDYTRPELLEETIRMGEAEADVHAPLLAELLA